jgi:uncharacterized protein (DUF433 family)
MTARKVGQYLVNDPEICHGQLTFQGTRLPVETVLNWLGKGKTLESILVDWPYLKREAVAEAAQLATAALLKRYPQKTREENEPAHPRRTARGSRDSRPTSKAI